jgi:hypothetical protein
MNTEELHEQLRGIQGCWDRALADLQEVSVGLEAIIKTPGENDLGAIAKRYGRDPKVFVIGIFDAVIAQGLNYCAGDDRTDADEDLTAHGERASGGTR